MVPNKIEEENKKKTKNHTWEQQSAGCITNSTKFYFIINIVSMMILL